MMTAELILAQIKSIESQLAELKDQVKQLNTSTPTRTFADLYGLLAGQSDSTEEEIEAAQIRFKWEDEPAEGIQE
jgi:hypothetical protein